MIGEDVSVAQDEPFIAGGVVGDVEELHVGFIGGAVGFLLVAGFAGGDEVSPGGISVAGGWEDVIHGEVGGGEGFAAVCADVAVAFEEELAREWCVVVVFDDPAIGVDDDDGADLEGRLDASFCIDTAAQGDSGFAEMVGDSSASDEVESIGQGDPAVGRECAIDGKDLDIAEIFRGVVMGMDGHDDLDWLDVGESPGEWNHTVVW